MSNLPLKALPWEPVKYAGGAANDAQGAGIYYRAIQRDGKHVVYWVDFMGGSDGDKSFDSWDELKEWVETTHYPHKMQPYVKPMPTWINYKTEKPKEGDDVVITWLWMGDRHTIHLGNYSPRKIDYLDDAIEVYWSISPFVKQGE